MIGCFHSTLSSNSMFTCLTTGTENTPKEPYISNALSDSLDVDRFPPSRRQVLFIGDSSVRQLYFAMVRLVDGKKGRVPEGWEAEAEKHSDRKMTLDDGVDAVEIDFWW